MLKSYLKFNYKTKVNSQETCLIFSQRNSRGKPLLLWNWTEWWNFFQKVWTLASMILYMWNWTEWWKIISKGLNFSFHDIEYVKLDEWWKINLKGLNFCLHKILNISETRQNGRIWTYIRYSIELHPSSSIT